MEQVLNLCGDFFRLLLLLGTGVTGDWINRENNK
jgi:hypothetical protein